jgi:chromosome segregation ATPase
MTTFITQQKRPKSTFEQRYLKIHGDNQERRIDLPGLSPALILKRQELEHRQTQLAADRLDYDRWLKEYQQRKGDIEGKMQEFGVEHEGDLIVKKRLKDEIERFQMLAEREYEHILKYEKQLQALNAKEADIKAKLAHYQRQLEILQPSAFFIEKVVGETKIFETTENIIQRYEMLNASRTEWTTELKRHLAEVGYTAGPRERLAYLQAELIERRNDLRSIREEIGKLRQQDRYAQVLTMKTAERAIEKEAEEAAILSSIANMCRQTLISQEREAGRDLGLEVPPTMEEQLEIVKQRFLDLQAVISDSGIGFGKQGEANDGMKSTGKMATGPLSQDTSRRKRSRAAPSVRSRKREGT